MTGAVDAGTAVPHAVTGTPRVTVLLTITVGTAHHTAARATKDI